MAELTRQEFRAAILYDYKRGLSVDECCRSLKQHFGELRAPSRTTIFNRYRDFKTGLSCADEVEDTATNMEARLLCKFVERVRELIRIDPSVSRLDIAKNFGLDLGFVETIVANALKLGQLNGQWVPVTLSESQRCLRADWASFMLDKFKGGSGPNADRIIACYHAWIYKCRTVKKSSRIATEYWTFEKSSRVVDKRMVICFFSRSGLSVIASVGNIRLLSPRNLIEGCLIDVIDEWSAESVTEDRLFLYIETLAHSSTRLLDFLYDRKVSLVALPECSADLQLGGSFLEPVFWTSVQKKRFPSHEDAVSAYKDCLNCAVPEMWHQLFDWWFRRIRKCLDGKGDYVEPIDYNTDINGYDAASLMVNPNSVMPSHHSSVRTPTPSNSASTSTEQPSYTATSTTAGYSSQTTSGSKRHFNFSPKLSPKQEVPEVAEQNGLPELEDGEAEASSDNDRVYENEPVYNNVRVYKKNRGYKNTKAVSEEEETEESEEEVRTLKATPQPNGLKLTIPSNGHRSKTTLLLPASTIKTISPQFLKSQQQQQAASLKLNGVTGIRLQNFKIVGQSSGNVQQLRRQIYNNNVQAQVVTQSQAQQQQQQLLQQQLAAAAAAAAASAPVSTRTKADKDVAPLLHRFTGKPYPKPAYSYSCLIAMALKNSQNGSLPVSEIYNFMCDHFPYFKTAPNGWKNSVRHNLSLNKCFEKIEKPAGSGNQRKGCLWAINPCKVAKMDEEVQKWSRKDPLAIKRAMIYPEHLELLERGEMKFAGHNTSDVSEETESSSGDEVEGSDGTVHSHQVSANSVTDSFDESSQDCDVDTSEHTYDEIDIDDNKESLHMQLNISKQDDYQLVSGAKRQKTITGTLQANYVYQPVTTARRKTPLTFLTTSAATGSFLKLE